MPLSMQVHTILVKNLVQNFTFYMGEFEYPFEANFLA